MRHHLMTTIRRAVATAMVLGVLGALPAAADTVPISATWTWGANSAGQLGDGTAEDRLVPVIVPGMADVVDMASGPLHTLALDSTGTVWSWGSNTRGQLGDATTLPRRSPGAVPGLPRIVSVAAGEAHSLALDAGGTVWAWGLNTDGRLGDGTTETRLAPVAVAGIDGVTAIATAGMESFAVRDDGSVWAWGRWVLQPVPQAMDDDEPNPYLPVRLPHLEDVADIAAGSNHHLALHTDGTVSAWGLNHYGQLGDGTTEHSGTPKKVTGLDDTVAVAAGWQHSLALHADGTVRAWGRNSEGQLGDGTLQERLTPTLVPGVADAGDVAAGDHHSLAVRAGTVLSWGRNHHGQLGDGTTALGTTPAPVAALTDVTGVSAAGDHSSALRAAAPSEPGVPTRVRAVAGDTTAQVSWSRPPDGGSPITAYTIKVWPGGATRTVPAGSTSVEISGLANGTWYRFAVQATNAVGSGGWSQPSAPVVHAVEPGAPRDVEAAQLCPFCSPAWSPQGGTVVVSWTPPVSDGGSEITGYRITRQPGNVTTAVGSVISTQVTGLDYGTSYTFTVTAVNAVGQSRPSEASTAVTPQASPASPTNVTASAGDGTATVSWTAPPDGGAPLTGYTVAAAPGAGGASVSVDGSATSATVPGLSNGVAYAFTVRAVNQIGESPWSALSNSVTPADGATPPDAPTGVRATAGVLSATVRWTAPADGGSDITGYRIAADPDGRTVTAGAGATSATVRGLTAGVAHTFTVTAVNAKGEGPASTASNAVRPRPQAVADLTRTIGFDHVRAPAPRPRVTLAWTTRGAPDAIRVTWTEGSRTGSVTLSPEVSRYTVTGLVQGRGYRFAVRALAGGVASAPASVSAAGSGISAAARPARATGARLVWGDLARAGTGAPLARRLVQLQTRTRTADGTLTAWRNAGLPVRTTAAGEFVVRRTLARGVRYRVVFAGAGRTLGSRSRTRTVR